MPHYSRLRMVVVDVPDEHHNRELRFWESALGLAMEQIARHPEYHGTLLPHQQQVGMLVQRLGEGPARVHLDFHTDDLAAEVARLEKLGARRERKVHDWCVMRDPAGLLFCVVPVPAGTLDGGNARYWE